MRLSKLFGAVISIAIVTLAIPALAKGWDETIREVELEAKKYWDFGAALGGTDWVGTSLNEFDIDRHTCTIAGRMLGKESEILELEKTDTPELMTQPTDEQLQAIMIHSISLSNWAYTSQRLLVLTDAELVEIWNLDCVGKMGISSTSYISKPTSSVSFRQEGDNMFVLGDIYEGFFEDFQTWLLLNPETKTVILGSGGGSVRDALKAGILIRQKNLETSLSSNCYSACPLVYLGGVKRLIWSPYPRLGFHRIYVGAGDAIPIDDPLYELIRNYANTMGADGTFVVGSMLSASPSSMFEPDFDSLCKSKVSTWIQRQCF